LHANTATDDDFHDVAMKPHILWILADDTRYGNRKGPLAALHQNPTGASGGERNRKAAKRVHSRAHSRICREKVESGTAIAFTGNQLEHHHCSTRESPFTLWLSHLGSESQDADDPAEEELDESEIEEAGDMSGFDDLDPNADLDNELFVEEEEDLEYGVVDMQH
jgi:hypothetical protein